MRVRANGIYRFDPCLLDSVICPEHCKGFKPGDLVKVVQLPGAPPPNTMGQANIVLVGNADVVGMCATASLFPQ